MSNQPPGSDREKLIAKIKALLSMTVENGASEAEMFMGLSRARKLMDEHGVTENDLKFNGETVGAYRKVKTDFDKIRDQLVTPVGTFCECRSWKEGSSDTLTFCGLTSEAMFAHWLLDMLADFVIRAVENHQAQHGVRMRSGPRLSRMERESFIYGCTGRIAYRLLELAPKPLPSETGRDLVVAKNALVEEYLRAHDIRLREPFKLYQLDAKAVAAGADAGDLAQFNRPVEGRDERKQLR